MPAFAQKPSAVLTTCVGSVCVPNRVGHQRDSPDLSALQSDSAHSATEGKNFSDVQIQAVSLAEQPVAAMALVMQMAWSTISYRTQKDKALKKLTEHRGTRPACEAAAKARTMTIGVFIVGEEYATCCSQVASEVG